MQNRNTGLIATIASAILCGCPGILACIFGALAAAGVPFTTEVNGVSNNGLLPVWVGVSLLCLALIFILIPVVVGFVTLRKRPAAAPVTNEPLPPAS
jgi:hypothetical protein